MKKKVKSMRCLFQTLWDGTNWSDSSFWGLGWDNTYWHLECKTYWWEGFWNIWGMFGTREALLPSPDIPSFSCPHAALTKYHRPGGLNYRHLFLMALEAGRSRVKVLADQFPVRALFLAYRQPPSYCALTWQTERSLSSYKTTLLLDYDFT